MPRIDIQISSNGDQKIEGFGFKGKACATAIDEIVRRTGGDPSKLEHNWKPEADLVETPAQQEGLGTG